MATCCSSLMSSPRKNTTPRCSSVSRMLAASRPLSSVSRSVLISLPIVGVRSTMSSCAEVSPMTDQLTLVRMVLAECFTRGCFHSSTAKRDGDQRVEQVAQVRDVVGQRFGVVELVDVGDGFLGVRETPRRRTPGSRPSSCSRASHSARARPRSPSPATRCSSCENSGGRIAFITCPPSRRPLPFVDVVANHLVQMTEQNLLSSFIVKCVRVPLFSIACKSFRWACVFQDDVVEEGHRQLLPESFLVRPWGADRTFPLRRCASAARWANVYGC